MGEERASDRQVCSEVRGYCFLPQWSESERGDSARGRTLISSFVKCSKAPKAQIPASQTTATSRRPGFSSSYRRMSPTACSSDSAERSHRIGCIDPCDDVEPFPNITPSSRLLIAANTVYPFFASNVTVSLPTSPRHPVTKTAGCHPLSASTRASVLGGIPPRSQSEVYSV